MRGCFISLEGSDGSGKSTVVEGLKKEAEKAGIAIDFTREPGGTPLAEKIREIILDKENAEMDPRCEALLYAASRAQHTEERILPHLEKGIHVFTERYVLSSLAYQGYGRKLGRDPVKMVNDFATRALEPDLILYLDVDPLKVLSRKGEEGEKDRLEEAGDDFFFRVKEGYEKEIAKSKNVVRINANQPPEKVIAEAWEAIKNLLEEKDEAAHLCRPRR